MTDGTCEDKPRVENKSNEPSIEMTANEEPTKILPAFLSKIVNVHGRKVPGVDVKTHSVITGYVAEAICRSLPRSLQVQLRQLLDHLCIPHASGGVSAAVRKAIGGVTYSPH